MHSSAEGLKLITFDADGTLYADGHHIEQDSEMIRLIVSLMRLNVHVSIVTAAGYPVSCRAHGSALTPLSARAARHPLHRSKRADGIYPLPPMPRPLCPGGPQQI